MVRFGVVGTSWITDAFISAAQGCKDFKLTAVYSRTRDKAESFASKYGVETVFTDIEEMAKSKTIDAVYIASPNSSHAPQSILFLKNKIAVLCEKPIASNYKEVNEAVEAAVANKTLYMEAMKSTFIPTYNAIKNRIQELGVIRHVFSSFCQYSSKYEPLKRGELPNAFNPVFSGGSLMDIGVYPLFFIVSLFGMPKSVDANALMLDSGVDGQGTVLLDYGTFKATILHSKTFNGTLPTEIMGEDGVIQIHRVSVLESATLTKRGEKNFETLTIATDKDGMYYETEHFIELFKSGKIESPVNSFSLSKDVMRLMDDIRRITGIKFPADR